MEDIPSQLIINWDQTGISIVPGSSWTMAPSGSRRVEIVGLGDKRQNTAVFRVSLSGDFLPPQVIYTGKTPASHPNGVTFPADWHITHTENHWANKRTMKDYITTVIVPYIEKIRSQLPQSHVASPQPALVIFDVFKGQMCQSTIDLLMENNIH
uniref:DDE-1 domain-containing protein n=1 Tax=Amphimedon queenslandica TaxID=400682 RepID=A0A1X7UG48_AMPQE